MRINFNLSRQISEKVFYLTLRFLRTRKRCKCFSHSSKLQKQRLQGLTILFLNWKPSSTNEFLVDEFIYLSYLMARRQKALKLYLSSIIFSTRFLNNRRMLRINVAVSIFSSFLQFNFHVKCLQLRWVNKMKKIFRFFYSSRQMSIFFIAWISLLPQSLPSRSFT